MQADQVPTVSQQGEDGLGWDVGKEHQDEAEGKKPLEEQWKRWQEDTGESSHREKEVLRKGRDWTLEGFRWNEWSLLFDYSTGIYWISSNVLDSGGIEPDRVYILAEMS